MGMYFLGGHIALEEVLAVQTLIVLQHIDVNPTVWQDPQPLRITKVT